jgi:hypothetical protein
VKWVATLVPTGHNPGFYRAPKELHINMKASLLCFETHCRADAAVNLGIGVIIVCQSEDTKTEESNEAKCFSLHRFCMYPAKTHVQRHAIERGDDRIRREPDDGMYTNTCLHSIAS